MDQEKSHHAVAKLTFGCKKFKKLTASRHFFKLARSYKSHLALAKRHLAVKIVKPSHAGRISILQLVFFPGRHQEFYTFPICSKFRAFLRHFKFVDKRGTFVHSPKSCIFCVAGARIWQFWHVQV